MDLTSKKCLPCEGSTIQPLSYSEIKKLAPEIPTWEVVEEYKIKKLIKDCKFKGFAEAMKFVNNVADIAESEGHHPNIYIHDWNKVKLELYTHSINGLHENDFILAAKIDKIN